MGEIKYITEKNIETKLSGFKKGDILVGQTHWGCTTTYWYQIVSMTKKLLTLKELDVSYPTQYMSNTPGDECMPVMEQKCMRPGEIFTVHYLAEGFPFWVGPRDHKTVTASIRRSKRYDASKESPKDKEWEYEADIRGDKYAPLLEFWDGKPGWVNCD